MKFNRTINRIVLLRIYVGALIVLLATLVLLTTSLEAAIPPAPKSPEPSPKRIRELIEDLGSPLYQEREQATKILLGGGMDVVHALTQSMIGTNGESSLRSFQILKTLYFKRMESGWDDEADEIEKQLETVFSKGTSESQTRVATLLESFEGKFVPRLVNKNAIRRLRAEGAKIRESVFRSDNERFVSARQEFDVVLSKQWKGTTNSMRFFKRIPSLKMVYLLPDAKLTEEELLNLRASLPSGKLERRGKAILGVVGSKGTDGYALITRVIKNLPADRAGILPGDRIIKMSDSKIESFDSLVEVVAKFEPGNSIPVTLRRTVILVEGGKQTRENRVVTLNVTFDAW